MPSCPDVASGAKLQRAGWMALGDWTPKGLGRWMRERREGGGWNSRETERERREKREERAKAFHSLLLSLTLMPRTTRLPFPSSLLPSLSPSPASSPDAEDRPDDPAPGEDLIDAVLDRVHSYGKPDAIRRS